MKKLILMRYRFKVAIIPTTLVSLSFAEAYEALIDALACGSFLAHSLRYSISCQKDYQNGSVRAENGRRREFLFGRRNGLVAGIQILKSGFIDFLCEHLETSAISETNVVVLVEEPPYKPPTFPPN